MKPTLKINQIRSSDENSMSYRITVTQYPELIDSENVLLNNLKDTFPYKKGIIEVLRIDSSIWEIKTNK